MKILEFKPMGGLITWEVSMKIVEYVVKGSIAASVSMLLMSGGAQAFE